MKAFCLVALLAISGCGFLEDLLTNYPCGLDCQSGACVCKPHGGAAEQFWVRTTYARPVVFYRCDCTQSRWVQYLDQPVPSDPERGECFAEVDGAFNPPIDCEMSRNPDWGFNPCIRVVEFGGSVACGSPR